MKLRLTEFKTVNINNKLKLVRISTTPLFQVFTKFLILVLPCHPRSGVRLTNQLFSVLCTVAKKKKLLTFPPGENNVSVSHKKRCTLDLVFFLSLPEGHGIREVPAGS